MREKEIQELQNQQSGDTGFPVAAPVVAAPPVPAPVVQTPLVLARVMAAPVAQRFIGWVGVRTKLREKVTLNFTSPTLPIMPTAVTTKLTKLGS